MEDVTDSSVSYIMTTSYHNLTNYEVYMNRIARSIISDFADTPKRYQSKTTKRKLWWAKKVLKATGGTLHA